MACMASLVGEHWYRRCCMDSLYKLESLTEAKYQGHSSMRVSLVYLQLPYFVFDTCSNILVEILSSDMPH